MTATVPTPVAHSSPGGPLSIAVVNDFELAVADARRVLSSFTNRARVTGTVVGWPPADLEADIALYDTFGRPGLGLDHLTALVEAPGVRHVAVYTPSLPPSTVAALSSIGVSGCLAKSLAPHDLVRAMERIAAGERVVALRGTGGPPQFRPGDLPLSYREAEVLVLLSQGLRNRAIASAIHVGEETVKSHLKSIYRKLGVASRGEAIARAYRSSTLDAPADPDTGA